MAGKMAADAASMVGDAALNGVFQGLAQALTPIIQKKLGQFWGVDKELKRLKRYLMGVQPLLNDAETRQFTEESVRSWVGDLRGLTYDMEDIVDEMNYELLRLQLENRDKSDGEQVQTLFSSLKLDKVFGAVENCSFNYQLASKINEVLERWDEIVEYGNALNLREGVGGRTLADIRKRRETTSFVDKDRVFGRESEKEKIISFLKSDEYSGRGNLSVIGIVGMGGLGKTTLAKLAYNDSNQFDTKAWVHVSHDFNLVRVTRSIIESIGRLKEEKRALDPLQCCLQELVKEKKLLLVLDDAWTENSEDWETLLAPLIRSVQKGSKIIATTRSEEVCKSMGSCDYIHRLKGLSDDDCWTIVKEKVIGYSDNANEQANLEKLRVKVVKKCQGLPLAANVVGGLLGTVHVDKWERLLENEIWELPKTKDYILPALMLSYLCLDPHQKRCFTYTATCLKRDCFIRVKMIRMWMAEGFIEANKSDEMEDIANDYFDNLVARHFFQTPNDKPNEYSLYVMHDLIRELAEVIIGNISLRIQGEIGIKIPTEETRHVSLSGIVMNQILLDKLVKAKSLRTLSIDNANIDEVLKQIDHSFERLRVLDQRGKSMWKISESIGNLKHLRYLNLERSHIESLPDSICSLYNLQTLDLGACRNLVELPEGIGSLINLRYLRLCRTMLQMFPDSLCKLKKLREINLAFCYDFVVLPSNIGDLNNLRSLDIRGTSVEKLPDSICRLYNLQSLCLQNCNNLVELPKEMINLINLQFFEVKEELIKTSLLPRIERFTNIRRLENYCITNEIGIGRLNLLINLRELRITSLENVKSVEEARVAHLKNKHQLVKLVMEWSEPNSSNLWDGNDETLEALEPAHANLRHLTVKNYSGFKFPSWLGNPSFSKLEEIELIGCRKCKLLTSFGQLRSLKTLVIEDMQELMHLGRESFGNGAFPSLERLKLKHLPNFEGQFEAKEVDFPRLIELDVTNCPKLRELPVTPLTLKSLILYGYEKTQECENLSGQDSEVGHCNEMIMLKSLSNLTSLSSFKISGFRRVKLLPNEFIQSLITIKYLNIENCDALLSLPEGPSTTLSKLCITNCPNMTSLGKGFQNMTCLKDLLIMRCPQLEFSPGELTVFSCLCYFEVVGCSKTTLSSVLPHLITLEELVIKEIDGLQYLPHDLLLNCVTLKDLSIGHCSELASLPNELPSSLTWLMIEHCSELASLPDELPSSLRELWIRHCTKLASLPDELPSSLRELWIRHCTKLASLPDELPSSLQQLRIKHCTKLASLPNQLPSSLQEFYVEYCDKIKSLPKGLCNLTSLIYLSIKFCPLVEYFPDDGLPASLHALEIQGCPTLSQRCKQQGSKEWSMVECIPYVNISLE